MIGQTFSHFRITAKLGEGGMGAVYRATDTKLDREVAIKVLPEEFTSDPERLARFEREAKVLASLNHPRIATIYSLESAETAGSEAGRFKSPVDNGSEAGRFLVMELVEGEDLEEQIARGPVGVDRALEIAAQIGEALVAAHERGIVHRDLKPANIKVTPSGGVKVLDFGLAKRQTTSLGAGDSIATATMDPITQENQIVGTIPYMSPEQIRAGEVGPRSDLFSLGVILFEMIGGSRPFRGDSQLDLIFSILKEDPPRLTDLRPEVDPRVAALISSCIEKDADSRIGTAAELRDRLEQLRRPAGADSGGGSPVSDASSSRRRRALDPRAVAVLPLAIIGSSDDADFLATGLHNDLITELSRIQGLTIISRASVMGYRETDKTPPEIARELNVGTLIQGTLQSAGSRVRVTAQLIDAVEDVQQWAERYDRELSTETLFDLQTEVSQRIVDSLQSELAPTLELPQGKAPTHNLEAYRRVTLGRVQVERRTERGCQLAIEHLEAAVELDPDYSAAWAGLAEALAISVWYGYLTAEGNVQRATSAAQRAVELDPDSAEAHCSLAFCYGAVRNGQRSMQELELAIRLQPSYWEAHNLLSYLYHLRGQAPESLAAARRAFEINPLSAEVFNHLSLSSLTCKDAEAALAYAQRAAELSPGWTTATFYEALALFSLARHTEVIALLEGLTVEWAGQGPQATLALTHLAKGDEAAARQVLATMSPGADAFAVGLVQLALGENETAFQNLLADEVMNDWACMSVHYLYPEIWADVQEDPRLPELVRRAYRSLDFEPPEGSHHA